MADITLTYGEMPTREQFDIQFAHRVPYEGLSFGNDKRVGTCILTPNEVWQELQKAMAEYSAVIASDPDPRDAEPEVIGDWISSVLYVLGIEWV